MKGTWCKIICIILLPFWYGAHPSWISIITRSSTVWHQTVLWSHTLVGLHLCFDWEIWLIDWISKHYLVLSIQEVFNKGLEHKKIFSLSDCLGFKFARAPPNTAATWKAMEQHILSKLFLIFALHILLIGPKIHDMGNLATHEGMLNSSVQDYAKWTMT